MQTQALARPRSSLAPAQSARPCVWVAPGLSRAKGRPRMKPAGGQTGSLWMATASVPQQAALRADVTASVCVIGAGIAGMTTAYLLARDGKSVIVVDDGPVAGGQTRRTTAHLSNAIDDRYFEI